MSSIHITIGIDVDEVLGDLHKPWLRWGNRKFGTQHSHFPDWDAPQRWWGDKAFGFLTPDIYADDVVRPIAGAAQSVRLLRALGYHIRFVTSCSAGSETEKHAWLIRHGFTSNGNCDRHEFVPGRDKSGAAVDLLIDDGFHNCKAFAGDAILVTRPHNVHQSWDGKRIYHIAQVPGILIQEVWKYNHPLCEIQEANDGR